MTDTPTAILEKANDLGLELSFKPPNTLNVEAARPWPRDFAETLREHKPQLLPILRLPYVLFYSRTLEENVFFCEDEETKAALVGAGADDWSIYTKAELRVLIAHNRVKPFLPDELCKVHKLKRTFNGRIK
ncbi:MAG TPA: hypothetical protein VGY75_07515 [Candidatus Udaeobacter sp.]|jgi:hypothetical protein|nr:hypothetical protein [Candidatus Udaeobacter sp.]